MEKWKYHVVHLHPDTGIAQTALDELGEQGWELVSVAVTPHGGSGMGSGGGTNTAYLKQRA